MNNDWFFEKFALIADAPGAVERMRQLILTLAMQGKLVPQCPDDEPANVLVAKLKSTEITENGRLRKVTSLPELTIDELPFDLPPGWVWQRLGCVGETNIGLTYSPNDLAETGVPVLRSSNIQNGKLDFGDIVRVKYEPKKSVMVQNGDLLICARNGSKALVGKVAVIENLTEPAAFGAFMAIFRSRINQYLYYFISSPLFRRMIDEVNTTTINQITQNNLRTTLAPIPPLAEQKRIVAKVEELMGLCDELEAQQQEREERKTELVRSSLSRFSESSTRENLGYLFHKSYDIPPSELRKSILTLAVQGKLVPQDPTDETAEELISRVTSEKARLVRSKEIKNEPPLDPITEGEVFSIPKNWVWCRAGAITRPISSGSTPEQHVFHPSEGIPYLKVYNIRNQNVDFRYKPQFISISHHREKMKRSTLFPGDVVMNIVGPPLGKVAIIPDSFPEWNCNQAISFFRPIFPDLAPWIYTFLKEGSFLRNIQLIGTAGQDNISVTKCKFIPIAIPPFLEQRRIVAKVNQLMALVDELERQQAASREKASNLLDAIVHEMTSGG